jgi:hypothetical protein
MARGATFYYALLLASLSRGVMNYRAQAIAVLRWKSIVPYFYIRKGPNMARGAILYYALLLASLSRGGMNYRAQAIAVLRA